MCLYHSVILSVCLFVVVASDVLTWRSNQNNGVETYPELVPADTVPCRFCVQQNCIEMDIARCMYYADVSVIMEEQPQDEKIPSNPDLRKQVDSILGSMMNTATMDDTIEECVPLVSKYTDCTKENICSGCQQCGCGMGGRWTCELGGRCAAHAALDVDKHILKTAMQRIYNMDFTDHTLKDKQEPREQKLHVTEKEQTKLEFKSIEKPFSGTTTVSFDGIPNATRGRMKRNADVLEDTTPPEPGRKTHSDIDSVTFDDIMNLFDRVADSNMSTKRKYIYDQDGARSRPISNSIHINNVGLSEAKTVNSSLDVAFLQDLLEGNDIVDKYHSKDKREITSATADNEDSTNSTTQVNNTDTVEEFKEHVFYPMSSIIDEKQRELEELLKIRAKLIDLITSCKNEEIRYDADKINETNLKYNDTYLSIYKMQILPTIKEQLRRSNTNTVLNKYLRKLKIDVYEVLRDLVGIQKFTKLVDMPEDVKFLARALKYYVHKYLKGDIRSITNNTKQSRRSNNFASKNNSTLNTNYVQTHLTQIFKAVYETQTLHATKTLSARARDILKRVLTQTVPDDFLITDPNSYNITKELEQIGLNWQKLTAEVAKSNLFDRLYNLKRLQMSLMTDIEKLHDVILIIDYTDFRRSNTAQTKDDLKIVSRIGKQLIFVLAKLKRLFTVIENTNSNGSNQNKIKDLNNENKKSVVKESLITQMKRFLRKSKQGFRKLVDKKPKNITGDKEKTEHKNKLTNKIQKFKQKFKQTLGIVPKRDKRSLKSTAVNFKKRIVNILPKYLRNKLQSASVRKTNN